MVTHPRAQGRRQEGGAAVLTLMLIAYGPAFMTPWPPHLVSPGFRIY